MANKKVPMRQCVGCAEMKSKNELIRVIKTPENEIVLDSTGKKNGRGAYLKRSHDAIELAKKKGALKRALEVEEIPDSIYEELKTYVIE